MSTFSRLRRVALAATTLVVALPASGADGHDVTLGGGGPDGVPAKVERALGGKVKLRADGLFRVRSARGFSYTTHGPDFKSEPGFENHGSDISPGDPERSPVCIANPASDYYQEVLYGYPSYATNQLAVKKADIQGAVMRMNAVLNEESIASGGPSADYKVRCDPDASIKVSAFPVPLAAGAPSFDQVVSAAQSAGFTNPRVDYTIFYDGTGPARACGTGYFYGDESLSVNNLNNNPGGAAGYGATYGGCWFGRTPMHENGHNQGAVQAGAPDSTGSGAHCDEADDVMCYLDGGSLRQDYPQPCNTSPGIMHFDCGWDSYFDSAPEGGEWLASHWNIGSTLNRFIRFGGPSADFSYTCGGLGCTFTDQSSASAGIASRSWSFGDGATSTAQSPAHTYGASGAYDVTLTVTDSNGAVNSLTKTVALNDNFADAQTLAGANTTVDGSNASATKETGEPNHFGTNGGGASVWYRWTAGVTGTATIKTCNSNFDTLLAVYTGTTVNALTAIVKNDDSTVCGASSTQSAVSFAASEGTEYRIAVDGYYSSGAPARGDITLSLLAAGDSTPPVTTISGGPAGATNNAGPSFSFSADEPVEFFQCSLGGGFGSCSSPKSYGNLADGSYTFQVRASDLAHNLGSPASRSFTVDTVVPDTRIDSGPSGTIETADTSFEFSTINPEASPSFDCSLDGAAFTPCASPAPLSGLGDGGHSFEVRARDAAGNVDPTPATGSFTVAAPDAAAPETTITRRPAAKLKVRRKANVSFAFNSSEAGSGFKCSLDGAAFIACSSPQRYSGLKPGAHRFKVKAIDAGGNMDPTPAAYRFKVKKRRPGH